MREVREALECAQERIARDELGLDAVIAVVCETARELVCADAVVVEFVAGDELELCAIVGAVPTPVGARRRLGTSLAGHAVRVGHPVCCVDALHDPRADFEAVARTGLTSVICAPLVHYRLPIGALTAGARRTHAFGAGDAAGLGLLADVIAARL